MNLSAKIYVAGHRGMVGSAVVRHLRTLGYHNIITRSSQELDLTQQQAVQDFMQSEQPNVAVIAAAKVGGIHANNTYPAQFIYQNLAIAQKYHTRCLSGGNCALAIFRQHMHLSQIRRATNAGKFFC